ncbi:MAG: hypothetical protein A2V78_02150 [Betaproteobacteria bacterium RBG_16_64_18]|nr:MAG: hypothetical protein A2V78_02150 [Betaproteobacteria bacterium RBG_16_64_18]OGA38527.1 MAG: hypothetical protein A3G26_08590 [Betaproteobacteria bacterium RIFCSPLOWO2_12_FULL_65_110]
MPRKFFRKYLPSHDSVKQNRHVARFGAFLHHPNLWHLNRHSVAGGVAIGMFSGLVPGPFQMLTAAILCVVLKVNLPVALFTTLYTNPFTIGPLYLVAYQIGRLMVSGRGAPATPPPDMDWSHLGVWLETFAHWMLSLGKPLGIGLVALALALAALGYLLVQLAWRAYVIRAWRRRAQRRH